MTDSVVAEGHVKIRDGKKWKSRWVVLRKPSPVADCLVLLVYKERGVKERNSVVLEHICGLEVVESREGVAFSLTILCLSNAAQLGFDSKEALLSWDLRLRYCLGEVHSFDVIVLPGTKLESGLATLHLCNDLLVIARDHPPVITGQWNILDLRRYGPVTNGFVFEGGTRCGYWAGVFFLSCAEGEQISFLFDCIVRGVSPSKGPFGLKPLLPESSAHVASVEARLDQEAADLEKRLSLLSHCTASSSSSSTADDRSTSGSSHNSDTSHSDSSVGSHLTKWAEPAPPILTELSFPSANKIASHREEKLSVTVAAVPGVPSKPAPLQRLQEIGWQSSSDSGIATASHSSSSGSFSSYTTSIDTGGPKEEYSSLFSLPPPPNPETNPCTCPAVHTHEYQVPGSLRYLYDTPRSLLQFPMDPEEGAEQSRRPAQAPAERPARGRSDEPIREQASASAPSLCIPEPPRDSAPSLPHRSGSSHSDLQLGTTRTTCSPPPAASTLLFTTCSVCRGFKRASVPSSVAPVQSGVAAGEKPAMLPTNQEQKNQTETSTASSLTNHNPRNPSFEEKRSPKGYTDSLSDLLGHYCPGDSDMVSVQPGLTQTLQRCCLPGHSSTGAGRTSLYEPMTSASAPHRSPAPWQPRLSSPSHHPSRSPIYEKCLQCWTGHGACALPGPDDPARADTSGQEDEPVLPPLRLLDEPLLHLHDLAAGPREPSSERLPTLLRSASAQPAERLGDVETSEEDDKPKGAVERDRSESAYQIMEDRGTRRNSESGETSRCELAAGTGQQGHLHQSQETADGPRGEGVMCGRIPHGPEGSTEMEDRGNNTSSYTTVRGKGATKCAQIGITATETAHRLGTQHALGQEVRLEIIEQRK
ncbi:uncharacterized protein LOC143498982 isoform X2 [Brachyhypopomus gauderio]|uniref:uncharacterized protein LOC143498982 isoform X2 n=1 Tax=Brachyhypopomus gauderio TaxID=698409 RepID=UPI00404188C9